MSSGGQRTGGPLQGVRRELGSESGHADRVRPFQDQHWVAVGGRPQSAEPLAALTAPERTPAQHQSLLVY